MHSGRVLWVMVTLFAAGGATYSQTAVTTSPVAIDSSRGAMLRWFREMRSVAVEYSLVEDYLTRPGSDAASGEHRKGEFYRTGQYYFDGQFRFRDGNGWYESLLVDHKGGNSTPRLCRAIDVYSVGRTESLVLQPGGNNPLGIISDPQPLPIESSLDIALGLRIHGMRAWLLPSEHDHIEVDAAKDGSGRAECVYRDGKGGTHRWVWDTHENVLVPVLYEARSAGGRLLREVSLDTFSPRGNTCVPMHVTDRIFYANGSEQRNVIDIKTFVVADPTNTPESYRIVWPVGSRVRDQRTGYEYEVAGQPKTLEDKHLFDVLANAEAAKSLEAGGDIGLPNGPKAVGMSTPAESPHYRQSSYMWLLACAGTAAALLITYHQLARRRMRTK